MMIYQDPRMVVAPKASIEAGSVKVIYDGAEWREGNAWSGWSVAELVWDGDNAVGIRWNGVGAGNVGNPQSRGVPTWFILPDPVAQLVLDRVRKL